MRFKKGDKVYDKDVKDYGTIIYYSFFRNPHVYFIMDKDKTFWWQEERRLKSAKKRRIE